MNKICVFYSKGRGFLEVLQCVRANFNDAELTAVVPPNYNISKPETAATDSVVKSGKAVYSIKQPQPFWQLVKQIRRDRYDVFVITFDSTRLRILAALSGAKQCAWCSLDGHIVPIRPTLAGAIASALARNIRGRLAYAWIWTLVRITKVS